MHPVIEVVNIDVPFPTFADRLKEIAEDQGSWVQRGEGIFEGIGIGSPESTDASGTRAHIMRDSEKDSTGEVTVINPHGGREHSDAARRQIAQDVLTPVLDEYNRRHNANVVLTM